MRRFACLFAVCGLAAAARAASADDLAPAPKAPAPGEAKAPAAKPSPPAVTVPTFENATCPIMGRPSSKALFTDTDKGRIYVCCPPCIKKIRLDPDRAYAVAFPNVIQAGNTVCPVTGKALGPDAVTVALQGYEIGVCGPTCVKPAQENAQIVLAKATSPNVVDVGNLTCPITGKAVVANAFCLVGDELIRLSSPQAVDEVRKDPVAALKAAKDIAAKQKASEPAPAPAPATGGTAPAK